MSSVVFQTPRVIADATKIPILGWSDRIYLVRTRNVAPEALRAGGARRSVDNGWYITRDPGVLLEPLEEFLPQIARKAIVPNVVDLIPETSWCASMANMLTAKSWALLREATLLDAGGCEDCGTTENLECHEDWAYNEANGVQKLKGLRSVCKACHETYHLGLASVKNRYSVALDRLVLINRIAKHEVEDYEDEIFSKFLRRSEIEWSLDLSLLAGMNLSIRPKFEEVAPNVLIGEGHMGEIQVSLSGVEILKPTEAGQCHVIA